MEHHGSDDPPMEMVRPQDVQKVLDGMKEEGLIQDWIILTHYIKLLEEK